MILKRGFREETKESLMDYEDILYQRKKIIHGCLFYT
jgi:hypothetical protein